MLNRVKNHQISNEKGDKSYVIACEWSQFVYENSKHRSEKLTSLKNEFKRDYNKSPVALIIDKPSAFSLSVALIDPSLKPAKSSLYSLMSSLCMTKASSLGLYKVDDYFWFAWVVGGHVPEQSDILFKDVDLLVQHVKEHQSLFDDDIVFHGERSLFNACGYIEGIQDSSIDALLVEAELEGKPFKSTSTNVLGYVLVALVLGLGYYGFDQYKSYKENSIRELEARRNEAEQEQRRLEQKENIKQAFFDAVYGYAKLPDPAMWVSNVVASLKDYENEYRGWHIGGIHCRIESNVCMFNWHAGSFASYDVFLDRFGRKNTLMQFDPSGDRVFYELKLPAIADKSGKSGQSYYSQIPKASEFYLKYLSRIQVLEGTGFINYTVVDSEASDHKPEGDVGNVSFKSRRFEIDVNNLIYVQDVANELHSPPFTLNEIEIVPELDGSTRTTLRGQYVYQ